MGVASPVGLGEQAGRVGLADEVFISHFADSDHLFFSAGHGLQGQGGLYFWPQHAQVRRQHVDEDLRGKLESRENYVLICCEYREQKKWKSQKLKYPIMYISYTQNIGRQKVTGIHFLFQSIACWSPRPPLPPW